MTLIYLASPYTDRDPKVREQRFQGACHKTARMITEGYLVYSPIVSNHPLVAGWGLQPDYEFWKDLSDRMISLCDEVHVYCMPGWIESKGILEETALARRLEKPIIYHNVET